MTWKTEGFNFIKEFFEKFMTSGHLSHAYIFSGQEMIGKKTFALELAHQINNTSESEIHPDIFTIDPSLSESGESIPIEQIRNAKNSLSLSVYSGPYKFVIVNNAEKMTTEAQNAFLKILEEPSDSSIIILVSAYPDELLPTITSRCQEIKFPNHSVKDIKKILLEEGITEDRAEFLSEFVNGRLGLGLKIVREDLYGKVKKYLSELADIKKTSLNDKLKIAQALNGEEGNQILREKILFWMLYLRMTAIKKPSYDSAKTLSHLIELNYVLGQPQFNRRLMLENFMVKMQTTLRT